MKRAAEYEGYRKLYEASERVAEQN